MSEDLPDRVVISSGTTTRELTVDEYFAHPLDQQLEMLFRGQVLFFHGQTQVRTTHALKVLRDDRAARAAAPAQSRTG